jgi:hypothetical protein
VCAERGLGNVRGAHPDLMVARAEIQLREEAGAVELVEEFADHRDRVHVLDRDHVQGAIVNTETPGVISLPHEHNKGGER